MALIRRLGLMLTELLEQFDEALLPLDQDAPDGASVELQ